MRDASEEHMRYSADSNASLLDGQDGCEFHLELRVMNFSIAIRARYPFISWPITAPRFFENQRLQEAIEVSMMAKLRMEL